MLYKTIFGMISVTGSTHTRSTNENRVEFPYIFELPCVFYTRADVEIECFCVWREETNECTFLLWVCRSKRLEFTFLLECETNFVGDFMRILCNLTKCQNPICTLFNVNDDDEEKDLLQVLHSILLDFLLVTTKKYY